MTTPEQLAKYRQEFEMQLLPATEMTLDVMGKYHLNGLENQWQGYLRAKQESEKSIKRLTDLLEVVENRFGLTTSDRAFLKSFGLQKESPCYKIKKN